MLVLFETPAGYAFFKLLDEKKLKHADSLYHDFETPESAGRIVKLKHFEKFADTTEALAAMTASVEGKVSKNLKKVLKSQINKEIQEQILVSDPKLGTAIKEKFDIQCLSDNSVQELMRCIRSQLESLVSGLPQKELTAMTLGLAHSLSRYKLKFSPDKVDLMIIQAVGLLDELDKELNNYVMRCREWYGWHFPELGKIVTDNVVFARTVKIIGTRENTSSCDLSDILPEEVEEKVKEAAEISMGTEISEEDIINIQNLCDQIIEVSNYRTQLYDYLKARMMAVAPNLTVLVGDIVGARLISHSGSLMNLAKHPASTVQILGAEKALFRALKTKKDTPKYGLIYHSQLIGQASTRNKGKMSRMLSAKAALATRVDALGEDGNFTLGAEHKVKLEAKLRLLEEGNIRRISGTGKAKAKFEKYHGVSEIKPYPDAADSTLPSVSKRKRSQSEQAEESKVKIEEIFEETTTPKKKKKKLKQTPEATVAEEPQQEIEDASTSGEGKKKKKKKIKDEPVEIKEEIEEEDAPVEGKKKKKKKEKQEFEESLQEEASGSTDVGEGKKKKKKVKEVVEQEEEEEVQVEEISKKKKKKKKHSESAE